MYKYEMHIHTNVCSRCGVSNVIEMVDAAKEKGYSGFVLTNHFYHSNTAIERSLPWYDFAKSYYDEYMIGKEYGDKIGIDVLFGIEEGYDDGKEVLVYGIDPLTLMENAKLADRGIEIISSFVRENDGFIAAAHPFRVRDYIPEPDKIPDLKYFDAIEAYNFLNSEESNNKAFEYAKQHNFPVISGGDCHEISYFGKAGLAFYKRIKTSKDLVDALRKKEYKLIINGEISEKSKN